MQKNLIFIMLLPSMFILSSCSTRTYTVQQNRYIPLREFTKERTEHVLEVTASAYTSCKKQTDRTPYLAAWNNRLRPNTKSIAVSRDLLALGLTNGTKVQIEGQNGTYKVLDKMHKKWKKKIDIYMGCDLRKAKQWGKRKVKITWETESLIPAAPTKR